MNQLKAYFDFFGKAIELNTNSHKLFSILVKDYQFFIAKRKINKPSRIEIFVNQQDCLLDKFLLKFFLDLQSILHNEYIMFHGAAVNKDDKVKIFLGAPESGKSTISVFAGQKGYRLLSDEICLINKKRLTIAPFPITPIMKIHPPTYRFLKEYGLSVYSQTSMVYKNRRYFRSGLDIKDLAEMNICLADKESPLERIFLFRKNGASLIDTLIPLCYYYRFRNPSELMDDLKFLFYLLERYLYQVISPFNLNSPEQRKLTYEKIINLLEL